MKITVLKKSLKVNETNRANDKLYFDYRLAKLNTKI